MTSSENPASIATLYTLENLDAVQSSEKESKAFKASQDSHLKGYDSVCLPLTTDKWRQRWEAMCLVPPASAASAVPDVDPAKRRESRRYSKFVHPRDIPAERRAEEWRMKPVFQADEVTMTTLEEAEGVTIMASEWLELDAADDWVRNDAETALLQELSYASYINIQSAILPPPRKINRGFISSYARIINACLEKVPYMQLSVRLPIYDPSSTAISALRNSTSGASFSSSMSSNSLNGISSHSRSLTLDTFSSGRSSPMTPKLVVSDSSSSMTTLVDNGHGELDSMWEMWDVIRSICDYNTRLTLALDLSPPLPTSLGVLKKWSAEAVRYIMLPTSTFIANTKGYPVLPKPTQTFIKDSMTHHPTVVLSGLVSGLHSRGGESAYSQYVRHLERTSPCVQAVQKFGTVENYANGYQDYLQAPLQPLMDNLQSLTYQAFEQDPVKYKQYEEAMYRALDEWPGDDIIIVCIAGAGRGPLVARCISAIERSKRSAFVYAVEKNPNAFVTLQHRQRKEWKDRVTLIFGDMRHVQVPEKADILVSELLGSFGDNELSPECLDGATRFLKPGGISIPSSYTAHLAPLSSSKLYNEARLVKDVKHMETPYVVMFQAVNILSGDDDGPLHGQCGPQVQECWEFEHPRRDIILGDNELPLTNSHNARSAKLNFNVPHAGVLHGLAGYFEAVLYDNIGLSIHPHRKDHISKDMLSWFPLFFPFKEPLYLPSNSELQVSIWRLTNERQVWYEWHAESFLTVYNNVPPHKRQLLAAAGATPSLKASPPLAPSPLVDAVDIPPMDLRTPPSMLERKPEYGLVKIGQTSLHNAGGRSSWIGL